MAVPSQDRKKGNSRILHHEWGRNHEIQTELEMSPPGGTVWLLCSSGSDGAGYVDTSQVVKVFLGALTRRLQGDQVKDVGALACCTGAHRRHALLSRLVHRENISGQSQAVAYKPGWLQSDTSSPGDCL